VTSLLLCEKLRPDPVALLIIAGSQDGLKLSIKLGSKVFQPLSRYIHRLISRHGEFLADHCRYFFSLGIKGQLSHGVVDIVKSRMAASRLDKAARSFSVMAS